MTNNAAAKARLTRSTKQAPEQQQQQPPTHAAMPNATFAALRQMLQERPFVSVAPLFEELGRSTARLGGKATAPSGEEVPVDLLAIPLPLWERIETLLTQSEAAPTFAVVRATVHLVAASPSQ